MPDDNDDKSDGSKLPPSAKTTKVVRRRSPRQSQESQESQESQQSQESRYSQDDQAGARCGDGGSTGMSQDFFAALNMSEEELENTRTLDEGSELAQSIGIVCVVSRPSTNKRQKNIKPFALQKTFYAYPKSASEEQKNKIKGRIETDIGDYRCQQYDIKIHTFGLPFPVEEICCVSAGYNLTAKMFRAIKPDDEPKKRKRVKEENDTIDLSDETCKKIKKEPYNDSDDDDADDSTFKPAKSYKSVKSVTASRALRSNVKS